MTETVERTVELSPTLRKLVDERLDGIERVLRSAALPRGERVQVVEDVERQLLDMLAELPHQPGRRDVLQALAKLDPPEAYLTEEALSDRGAEPRVTAEDGPIRVRRASYSRLALASMVMFVVTLFWVGIGLLGIVALPGNLLLYALFVAPIFALTTLGFGVSALVAMRRAPQLGIGFTVAAVVMSAWILVLCGSYFAALMLGSELAAFVFLVLKDIPFGVALIWSLSAALKKRD